MRLEFKPNNRHIHAFTVLNLQRNRAMGSSDGQTSQPTGGKHQLLMRPETIRFPRHRRPFTLFFSVPACHNTNPSRLTAFAFLSHSCKCKEAVSGLNGSLSVLDGMLMPSRCFGYYTAEANQKASHCNGPK